MKYFESNFNEFLNEKRTKEERQTDKTDRKANRDAKKTERKEKRDIKGSKKEDRKKKKVFRKSKTIRKIEHRLEKAKLKKDEKRIKRLEDKLEKLNGKITNIVTKYNDKDVETKLKIKYTSKTIRQLKKEDASNKDIEVLKRLLAALKQNAEEDAINEILDDINDEATYDALIANFKKADDTAEITTQEVEEQDKEAEKKIDDRKGGTPEEVVADEKPEAQESQTKQYNYYKELFKGLENHINDATAPKLSKALAKKRIAEVQFLQKFLNDNGFFNVSEKVQFIPKEDNVDGYFGKNTALALKRFQVSNDIADTGVADVDTWKKVLDKLGFPAKEDFKLNTQYMQLAKKKSNANNQITTNDKSAQTAPVAPVTPSPQSASNDLLDNVVDQLIAQNMWRPWKQTREKQVYNTIMSLIKSGKLNNSNADEFINLYNTKVKNESIKKGDKSKGLVQDIIDAFDVTNRKINNINKGGLRPTSHYKYASAPNKIATNIASNDAMRAAYMMYWFGKIGGPNMKGALKKAGVNIESKPNAVQPKTANTQVAQQRKDAKSGDVPNRGSGGVI